MRSVLIVNIINGPEDHAQNPNASQLPSEFKMEKNYFQMAK